MCTGPASLPIGLQATRDDASLPFAMSTAAASTAEDSLVIPEAPRHPLLGHLHYTPLSAPVQGVLALVRSLEHPIFRCV